ncbi:hypothetical protein B7463_g9293, partial [Scytalidium lignicola]
MSDLHATANSTAPPQTHYSNTSEIHSSLQSAPATVYNSEVRLVLLALPPSLLSFKLQAPSSTAPFPEISLINVGYYAAAMATIQDSNGSTGLNGTLPKVRRSPSPAAPQQFTHYHSYFTSLLSWDNPRASGIAFASTVLFILAVRYLDILRYAFKLTWMTLGVTVLAEIVGQTLISQGLTSQFRPKKYYTFPKETLDSLVGDVQELINFFIIEAQRIIFAENVYVSGAAFLASFISYFLVKIVPYWGLALIGSSVLFLAPLIYKSNKEVIDLYLRQATDAVNEQAEHVKQAAAHHAAQATDATKHMVSEYSAKAQEMISRGRSVSPIALTKPQMAKTPTKSESGAIPSVHVSEPDSKSENLPSATAYKADDFPLAPTADIKNIHTSEGTENSSEADEEPPITL